MQRAILLLRAQGPRLARLPDVPSFTPSSFPVYDRSRLASFRCAGPRLARTAVSAAPPQEFLQQQAPLQYDDSLLSASQPIEEREFNKEVANAVTIIGSAYRLELKYGAKPRLNGSLRVGRGEGKDPEWFNFIIFGDIAEQAAREIQNGQRLQVIGRLSAQEYQNNEGQKRTRHQIIANKLYKIKSNFGPPGQASGAYHQQPQQQPLPDFSSSYGQPPPQQQQQQQQNADYWNQQQPPQQPQPGTGFAQPGTGFAQPASTPSSQPQAAQGQLQSAEDKWNDLFTNYNGWFDNRTNKRNPKSPDFKKKGPIDVALWLSSRDTPVWVKDEIYSLGQAQGSTEQMPPF